MYVYIKTETNCYTVGFYDPQGEWHPESDYSTPAEAANQVSWLNGNHPKYLQTLEQRVHILEEALQDLKPETGFRKSSFSTSFRLSSGPFYSAE